jgi:hypothetical protein
MLMFTLGKLTTLDDTSQLIPMSDSLNGILSLCNFGIEFVISLIP